VVPSLAPAQERSPSARTPSDGPGAILVIDNYDSFTFNLVQLVLRLAGRLGATADVVRVIRNDASSAATLLASSPGGVLLSPGPGLPRDAGLCGDLVRSAASDLPVFGVCLGMQILAEGFGARVVRAPRTMHGRTSRVRHDGAGCFEGLPQDLVAMRYHSWVVDEASGAVTLMDEADAVGYGVVDEIARRVWLSGGRVLAVRRGDIPGGGSVAAILRYPI